ncbi:MAG TPA: hypothetical protein VLG36_04440 [Candidatus Chromulinivoraceae bacterium]|nr:hypothetical protein [Candidatus Chromulinivoraceae bacterium]
MRGVQEVSEYIPPHIIFEGEDFPVLNKVSEYMKYTRETMEVRTIQARAIARGGLHKIVAALQQERGKADTRLVQPQPAFDFDALTTISPVSQEAWLDSSSSDALTAETPQVFNVYSDLATTLPDEDHLDDGIYFAKTTGGKDDSSNEKTQARQKAIAERASIAAAKRREKEAEDARLAALEKIKKNADLQKQIDDAAKRKK